MNVIRQHQLTSWRFCAPSHDQKAAVVHAGQKVPVVIMGTMGGMRREGVSGEDTICRAQDGACYYLVRHTYAVAPPRLQPRVRISPRLRRRWVRVHRISVRAGVLLALSWGQSRVMRKDLAALFKT